MELCTILIFILRWLYSPSVCRDIQPSQWEVLWPWRYLPSGSQRSHPVWDALPPLWLTELRPLEAMPSWRSRRLLQISFQRWDFKADLSPRYEGSHKDTLRKWPQHHIEWTSLLLGKDTCAGSSVREGQENVNNLLFLPIALAVT